MARIAINGMSAKSGGGKSVLRNILGSLVADGGGHDYVVIAPTGTGYGEFACDHIRIVEFDGLYQMHRLTWFSLVRLPRLLRAMRCDLLFNPSDVPIRTSIPQLFLFDWPHAAFPESPAVRMLGPRDQLIRKVKQFLFERNLRFVDILAAQTSVIAERMRTLYHHRDVIVVPNAVSLENLSGGEPREFALGDGFKLLCLSAYYTHKNLEIFVPVARRLRDRGIAVRIVITIAADQHPNAARMLAEIAAENLGDIIHNVGPVDMAHVPSLYAQSDALILPTLLESFSGTYVEAMYHRRPVLTSKLPFAEIVCGECALYFDPMDADDIVDKIDALVSTSGLADRLTAAGDTQLAAMPSWPAVVALLTTEFDRALRAGSEGSRRLDQSVNSPAPSRRK